MIAALMAAFLKFVLCYFQVDYSSTDLMCSISKSFLQGKVLQMPQDLQVCRVKNEILTFLAETTKKHPWCSNFILQDIFFA